MFGIEHLLALDRRLIQDVALSILDPLDADRVDAHAAVGERRIRGDQLDRFRLARADVNRRIGRQRRRDAVAPRLADHRLLPQRHAELDRREVARQVERLAHRHRAERRVVIVLRLPERAVELDHRRIQRRVVEHLRDGMSGAHRGRIDERFERGAGRPRRLCHAIPFRVDEIAAANHRQDVAGARIEREQRALEIRCKRSLIVGCRAALLDVLAVGLPLELAVRVHARFDLVELRLERLLGRLLHVEVERRVDPQALLVEIAAEAWLEEGRTQPLDEVRRHVAVARAARRQDQRIRLPELVVLGAQESLIPHQIQHGVATPHGPVRMRAGIVCPWSLRQSRQGRGLRDVQVARGFAEEHLRGRLDAGNVRAQADLIQIQLEDRVLREGALELDGHARFTKLAGDLLLAAQMLGEDVPRQLHRDRREPLRIMQRRHVGFERTEDPPVVDTMVLVEAFVFDGDKRLADVHGDLLEGEHRAALDAELRDQTPIGGVDLRRLYLRPMPRIDPHDAGRAPTSRRRRRFHTDRRGPSQQARACAAPARTTNAATMGGEKRRRRGRGGRGAAKGDSVWPSALKASNVIDSPP